MSRGGQGQSAATAFKERGFIATLATNIAIFNSINAKLGGWAKYHQFDTNCGSGWNDSANVMGSPLAFHVARGNTPCVAYFVDKDPLAISRLRTRPEMHEYYCVHEDNAAFVARIPDIITKHGDKPEQAIGSVLIDSNGFRDAPINALIPTLERCRRLDVILSISGTNIKRVQGAIQAGTLAESSDFFDLRTLVGSAGALKKKHWLIKEPVGQQWTILVGRNAPVGDYPSELFSDLSSERGEAILSYIMTKGAVLPPRHKQLCLFEGAA